MESQFGRRVAVTPIAVFEVGEGINRRLIVKWYEKTDSGQPSTFVATCRLRDHRFWPQLQASVGWVCLLDLIGVHIVRVIGPLAEESERIRDFRRANPPTS